MNVISLYYFVKSQLSGYFWLLLPQKLDVAEADKCYFVILTIEFFRNSRRIRWIQ